GSIGKPADGVEMRIVGVDGSELPDGTEGEITIRSATVFKGYWNNPDATRQVLDADGWFSTGDMGYRDSDGHYFITDRKKDIIISHGYNISPREVEEVIAEHPKVAEAAVVNIVSPKGEETVTAFVVPRFSGPDNTPMAGEEPPSHRELQEYCELHLAPYKRPRSYVLLETLPKSVTGKVLRKELRGGAEDKRLVSRRDT
ncbi:MAG TPA: AMP-binding protein, partial [Magnetospirillaceae bacterium]|nr:AMP-binding protein [Magnetospirillaceae bacterium]